MAHACSSTDGNRFINGQDFRSRIFVPEFSLQDVRTSDIAETYEVSLTEVRDKLYSKCQVRKPWRHGHVKTWTCRCPSEHSI